ncbi:prepilin peptidase [Streptomyces rimosus]|uniref:prepilin peptidase n=1 Tax=Streptomyces rimosus TaxID=1927 RepID=UPI000D14B4CB|nr:A24 family peptidase [Streptomyces rimosus]
MAVMVMVFAAVYGAAAGVLVPRPAYRLAVEPGEAWRVRCPGGHPVAGPWRGWLGVGRCRSCGPYGPRAVPVALVTAVVCVLLAAATGPRPELVAWLAAAPVAVLLAVVDWRVRRLPDVLTLPLAGGAALLLGGAALGTEAAGSWGGAVLGGFALAGFYYVLYLINPAGMGLGDVKLAIGLGVTLGWYGWAILITGAFAGLLLGALYGCGVLLRRAGRAERRNDGLKQAISYGPFMIIGAFLGVLLGGAAAS